MSASLQKLLFLVFFWASNVVAKPLVVSANTILADLVRVVGADKVESACFLLAGLDPHDFEPKPADLRLISRADLVIVNGLGLEGWLTKLVQNSGFHGQIVVASEGIIPLHPSRKSSAFALESSPETERAELDPHAWHDPKNVRRYVENIRDALVALDVSQAETYAKNAAAYLVQLDELDSFAREKFSALSADRRKLVTSHDALAYLGRAYALTIVSISGLHPDREPSAKQLVELVKFLRAEKVRAVFFEATSNPKLVELLAKEAGLRTVEQLYTDSLGPPGTRGSTYLGMARSNVETIVRALE